MEKEKAKEASVDQPTIQEVEAEKAVARINFYRAGGSRPVFISRAIVGGIVLAIWLILWLRG